MVPWPDLENLPTSLIEGSTLGSGSGSGSVSIGSTVDGFSSGFGGGGGSVWARLGSFRKHDHGEPH